MRRARSCAKALRQEKTCPTSPSNELSILTNQTKDKYANTARTGPPNHSDLLATHLRHGPWCYNGSRRMPDMKAAVICQPGAPRIPHN